MNFKHIFKTSIGLLLLTVILFSSAACGNTRQTLPEGNRVQSTEVQSNGIQEPEDQSDASQANEPLDTAKSLNVALFPYVPDVEKFQSIIESEWKKLHPEIALNFREWDCYDNPEIDDSLDVLTFDAVYLTEYAKNGELLAIEDTQINEKTDILNFVNEGIKYNNLYYGIPQMICANLFFYREDDSEMAAANTIDQLYDIIGASQNTGDTPELLKGLLVDMSSGTGNICFYLDAIIDANAVYTDFTEMPDLENINEKAIEGLNQMILMEGSKVAYSDCDRGALFGDGYGRAYIGYSETMAAMGDSVSTLKIKTMSLADREDIPLFYVDLVGINSSLSKDQAKKELALELANLMTSQPVMTQILSGGQSGSSSQYILPARSSCYEDLKAKYPIYEQLENITKHNTNHVFRMGGDAHEYITNAKKILPEYLLNNN